MMHGSTQEEAPVGPGMDQGAARRRARELGGIAVTARNPEKVKPWRLGGWPKADDVWIVISLDRQVVLDDGGESPKPYSI